MALLHARPDLAVPRPGDFTMLVARVTSRASVQRVIDGLDTAALQVLDVLAALPEPVTPAEVGRRWGASAAAVLARLRALALVWGPPRALRLVRAVRDVLGPYPAGLGPPLAEALGRRSPQRLAQLLEDLALPATGNPDAALAQLSDHLSRADVLDGLLADAPAGVQAVLDRLTWGPPVGQVSQAGRPVRRASANGPVEWLLAHGLLAVADAGHVVLPREVGLALRGGRVHRVTGRNPPQLPVRERPLTSVAGIAAGAAAEAVRLVEELGERWGTAPPPVLRAGGVGVRELHRTAVALDVDDATAARVAELAYLAGLIADDAEADPRWAPTPTFDAWRMADTGRRWAELAAAWLQTTRCPGLVGTRDARESPRAALGGDLDRAAAPGVRGWVLRTLAEAPVSGADKVATTDAEALRARLDWMAPRRASRARDAFVDWALDEAAWLGVTGAGGLAPHSRPLLTPGDDPGPSTPGPSTPDTTTPDTTTPDTRTPDTRTPVTRTPDTMAAAPAATAATLAAAATALDAALPERVNHFLLQADLTAVAPGPLEPDLARELGLVADVESRGGATVYRFSPASVRRALDAGRTADDVLALLDQHSRTEVPQPLRYLVGDVARRHGRVRVGTAQSFVRADDEAALTTLLAHREAAALRLRRLAPTVLAAQEPATVVLEVLRDLGLAPVVEGPDGDVLLSRPRAVPHQPPDPAASDLATALAAVAPGSCAQRGGAGHRGGDRSGRRPARSGRSRRPAVTRTRQYPRWPGRPGQFSGPGQLRQ